MTLKTKAHTTLYNYTAQVCTYTRHIPHHQSTGQGHLLDYKTDGKTVYLVTDADGPSVNCPPSDNDSVAALVFYLQ